MWDNLLVQLILCAILATIAGLWQAFTHWLENDPEQTPPENP